MTQSQKEWLGIVAFGITAGAFLAVAVRIGAPDDCKPRDRFEGARQTFNLVIGGAMLMAGCPDERTPRLIYRNDGSVTPP